MSVFPNESYPHLRSCSLTNFADMSNIIFSMRSVDSQWILIVLEILPHECRLIHRYSHKRCPNLEYSSPSLVTLEILFCLFRTWSFSWFTNDLDSTDNSNSDVSLPMMKFWEFATSWKLILSGRPDLARSVSWYLADCAVPSRRISPWSGRICCTILQKVLPGCPVRSCVVVSAFHSWEDQERSQSNFEYSVEEKLSNKSVSLSSRPDLSSPSTNFHGSWFP